MSERQYLCIDQRSFYATVECVARGLIRWKQIWWLRMPSGLRTRSVIFSW